MCGEWCRWLQNKDNPEELKKLYYWSKVEKALEAMLQIIKMLVFDMVVSSVQSRIRPILAKF
jgi:hypothetical protein